MAAFDRNTQPRRPVAATGQRLSVLLGLIFLLPIDSTAQIAWTETTVDGTFDGAISLYAADIDGDGDLDVVGAASTAADIAWWENTAGDGSAWTKTTIDASFDGATSVFAADIDGDGDLDVIGAANTADDVAWWENDGTPGGANWTKITIDASFDGATSVYAADVDGDDDLVYRDTLIST